MAHQRVLRLMRLLFIVILSSANGNFDQDRNQDDNNDEEYATNSSSGRILLDKPKRIAGLPPVTMFYHIPKVTAQNYFIISTCT
jgi:hypothetical protein